jgi:acyl-CoA synthetase (AMP-forming)/AMP-acid ligase II
MIFRSPYPDVEIPEVSLSPFVLRQAERLPDKPALVDASNGRTLTYCELAAAVRRAAIGLKRHGFQPGDVLAIYAPSLPEYAVALLAAASLGGITTPVNPLSTTGELEKQLNDAGAAYVLTAAECIDRAAEAAGHSGVREVFAFGEAAGATPFASLLAIDGDHPAVSIDPAADVALLPYSSGTTGLPKGVMLTHRNLIADICQLDVPQAIGEEEVVFAVPPFFHIYGVLLMTLTLAKGATLVALPRFELAAFLRAVEEHRVTRAYAVPPIVLALAKQPIVDEFDVSTLKLITCGAAPLGVDLIQRCEERLGCTVIQAYGLTEASPATHSMPARGGLQKVGSIGPCVPNTECKVIDVETGAELGPGAQGELWIRGPQVMKGYLNRPEATTDMLHPDGWLRTGDIVYADEDGHVYVVDRLKELIKYKGYQVAPAELEAVLLAHPAVADAAVIPCPDDEAGEVPKAFVVLRADVATEELMTFVAERVAPQKRVRKLEVTDQIPKSATGKILRRVLVERERATVLSHA